MRCPRHLRSEVVGYCHVCGAFGCAACLNEYEGAFYCHRDFQPIEEKIKRQKRREESRLRVERPLLVVCRRDDHMVRGICMTLNPHGEGFHLEQVDAKGEAAGKNIYIPFEETKVIYYVKSFDGNFADPVNMLEWQSKGEPIAVIFEDGELLRGTTMHGYRRDEARFFLLPEEKDTNCLRILVERAATQAIYPLEEFRRRCHRELEHYIELRQSSGAARNEIIGDYYFEHHDYARALKYYRAAREEHGETPTLRKKLISTKFNLGIRHLRVAEYDRALEYMTLVLKADPENERARKKAKQLRDILDRVRMTPASP